RQAREGRGGNAGIAFASGGISARGRSGDSDRSGRLATLTAEVPPSVGETSGCNCLGLLRIERSRSVDMVLLESEQRVHHLKKYDGRTKPIPRKGSVEGLEPAENKCLLRATDGKKKISTVVSSKEVNKFQMAYSNLLRANMDGLKKRDKKNKNKKIKTAQ
uniref:Signal recognition particle 14 kDa protein n=1 Tax=Castor canadensis TaxID=51338 RepID=A0A8B7VHJ4_CASCN